MHARRSHLANIGLACLLGPTVLVAGAAVADEIDGTPKGELIEGTAEPDTISGLGGNDTIRSRAGGDTVYGGRGPDTIEGQLGNDTLLGGRSGDLIRGQRGDDVLYGQRGQERIEGGPGDDTMYSGGAEGRDISSHFGNTGDDVGYGLDGRDFFDMGRGADVVHSRRGQDFVQESFSKGGSDRYHTGAGPDQLLLRDDGRFDHIDCGPGDDSLLYEQNRDPHDEITGCETIGVLDP